jgi:hypothetical protein
MRACMEVLCSDARSIGETEVSLANQTNPPCTLTLMAPRQARGRCEPVPAFALPQNRAWPDAMRCAGGERWMADVDAELSYTDAENLDDRTQDKNNSGTHNCKCK